MHRIFAIRRWSNTAKLWLLVALLLYCATLSLTIGLYRIPPSTIPFIIASKVVTLTTSWAHEAETIIFKIRFPRIAAAVLVGAALSISGAAYQGLFRNPLVSPDLLGVTSGAGFGAAIAMLASFPPAGIQAMALVSGLLAVLITYLIARTVGRQAGASLVLILAGIIVGALFTAFISIIKYVADPFSALPAITYWLMGGLSMVRGRDIAVALVPMLAGSAVIFLLRWNLNVMSFGDEEARALGINTGLVRLAVIGSATLITACAVALSGVIGLVGLVVPHITRALFGPDFRIIIPASALVGALFLLAMDDLARSITSSELPLGVLTELVGAPFFLLLLSRSHKSWA